MADRREGGERGMGEKVRNWILFFLALFGAVWGAGEWTVTHADSRYLLASDYRADRKFEQQRRLHSEQRSISLDVQVLEAKARRPSGLDDLDRVRLNEKRRQLQEIQNELLQLNGR